MKYPSDSSAYEALPRVTAILLGAGIIDTSFMHEHARDRGSAAHRACELHDLGLLDEASVHPEVAPYLSAWRRFRSECSPTIEAVEMRICGAGYRGTLDRVLRMSGNRMVADIKTGPPAPWHALQLAAYSAALDKSTPWRLGVHLKADGSYTLQDYLPATYAADIATFTAALRVAQWKASK